MTDISSYCSKCLLLILLCTLYSCENTKYVNVEDFLFESNLKNIGGEKILLIPQNGCSTCVYRSYQIIKNHYNDDRIRFVFTHYSSVKAIKIRLRQMGFDNLYKVGFLELDDALGFGFSHMFASLITTSDSDQWTFITMNKRDGSDWDSLLMYLSQ